MADANYSNTALPTTLSGSISAGATTITVGATTGFPGAFPYTLALDYGAGTEELVSVTAAAGLNLTVTRGFSGTSAQSHSLGAAVRHVYHAGDATDFRTHQDATTDVHGVTGALVGATQAQTLTNKTLTTPTINNGALSGTFTGNPTLSGTVTTTGVVESVRAASTDNSIGTRVSGDAINRFTIRADGQVTWGGGALSRDVNLYRAEANVLATDDTIRAIGSATSANAFETRVSGDTGNRYLIESNGGMGWGDGAAALDISLGRTAAGQLTATGDFIATGDMTAANYPQGAWTAYAPIWSSTGTAPAIGNGSIAGVYKRVDSTVHVSILCRFGTTTTFGTGTYGWSLPAGLPVADHALTEFGHSGAARGHAAAWYAGVAVVAPDVSSGTIRIFTHNAVTEWSPTVPVTWAANSSNYLNISLTYETSA